MIQGKFNVVTDGQWGSTGKGLIASYLAHKHRPDILSTTNMANAGHCQVAGTYIITNNGLERIGQVVTDESATSVVNMDGEYEKVSLHYYDGIRHVNYIDLHNGIRLGCTDSHRYWVWDTQTTTADWVRSMDLDPARHVFLFPKEVGFCDNRLLPDQYNPEPKPNRAPVKLPTEVNGLSADSRFARYLGQLVGDGYYAGTQKIQTAFHQDQLDAAHDLIQFYLDMGIEAKLEKVKKKKCWTVTVRKTSCIFELFKLVGMNRATKDSKTTPAGVMRSSKKTIAAYLCGLFDADGSVKRDRVQLSNCSKSVVLDAQQLLYVLGIHSCFGVYHCRRKTKRGRRLPQYTVSISSKADMLKFSELIGFISKVKSDKLRELLDRTEDQGQVLCVSDDLRPRLKKNGLAGRGKTRTTAVIEKLSCSPDPELARLAITCGNYHLVAIRQIHRAADTAEVFDLTVPGTHSYIANGCISHNTAVNTDGESFVAKALPSTAIVGKWNDTKPVVVLGPSAAFHLDQLLKEAQHCGLTQDESIQRLIIHPRAGVITDEHRSIEGGTSGTKHIASTMQGCGAFLSDKVMRRSDLKLARDYPELDRFTADQQSGYGQTLPLPLALMMRLNMGQTILHEGSQGFSLDIHHGSHYPNCTSRQTTATQNLADMGLTVQHMGDVYLVIRPYPIRVGNVIEDGVVVGNSGGCYDDHSETTWQQVADDCGMPEDVAKSLLSKELTTVTKRLRRVFTFSKHQISQAVAINGATKIAINFSNYIDYSMANTNDPSRITKKVAEFIEMVEEYCDIPVTLVGTGPQIDHVIDFEA